MGDEVLSRQKAAKLAGVPSAELEARERPKVGGHDIAHHSDVIIDTKAIPRTAATPIDGKKSFGAELKELFGHARDGIGDWAGEKIEALKATATARMDQTQAEIKAGDPWVNQAKAAVKQDPGIPTRAYLKDGIEP